MERARRPHHLRAMSVRRWLAVLVALVASVQLWLHALPVEPRGFAAPDAYHYADIGRQLARGKGITTLQTYPYVLAWLRQHDLATTPPWPNVARFPLLPLLYAPLFRAVGEGEEGPRFVGRAFHVATTVATFLLGATLFGNGVGLVAAVLQASTLGSIGLARAGLPDGPAAFAMVVVALGVTSLSARERREQRGADRPASTFPPVVLGVLLGLAFLLRYDLVALLVAALAVVAWPWGAGTARRAALLLAGFAVPVLLLMLHDALATGAPGAYLGLDRNVLGGNGGRDVYGLPSWESPWRVLWRDPGIVIAKLRHLAWPVREWRALFGWRLGWLAPLALVSCVALVATRHRAAPVCVYALLAFALRVLLFTVTHHEQRFYAAFTPVLLVLGLGGAWGALLGWWSPAEDVRRVAGALIATVVVAAFVWGQRTPGPVASFRRVVSLPDPIYEEIRRRTPAGTIFASSESEPVAWLAERPVVNAGADQLAALDRLGVSVDALLYRTGATPLVRHALARQGLAEAFVPVAQGAKLTLWLRRALVAGWQQPAVASSADAQAG